MPKIFGSGSKFSLQFDSIRSFCFPRFRATLCALSIDVENANTALVRYLSDNPLFDERSMEVKLLRQLIGAVEEQNKELFMKIFDETPLTPVRADRFVRLLIDEIGKKMNGDVDLK